MCYHRYFSDVIPVNVMTLLVMENYYVGGLAMGCERECGVPYFL